MKAKLKRIILSAMALAVCVAVGVAWSRMEPIGTDEGMFYGTAWALFPPIVAIFLALITKEVYSSLFIGILVGAFMSSELSLIGMVTHSIDIISSRLGDNGGIIIFLICLGIIVSMMTTSGCSRAFGIWASRFIKSKRSLLIGATVMGIFFCIDDYFNALTIGNVVRPITDNHRVSRARLAYNVDCTSAPLCIIMPISSWAAAVASYIPPEVEADGFSLFLRTIPFNLYAILTLTMLIALAVLRFDFGPMRSYEYLAEKKGDIYGGTGNLYENMDNMGESSNGRALDMILPVVVLMLSCLGGLLYTGGFFDGAGFIEAFGACDAGLGLPIGGLIALAFTAVFYLARRIITMRQFAECIPNGAVAMAPALFILTLSWGIESVCRESLGASLFVQGMFADSSFPMFILPAVLYLLGTGVSFATGTSWGTFGILIPITFAIFGFEVTELCMICLAATLAGAVTGDHCSPISETAIMSATAAQVDFMTHVMTQLPYTLFTAAICLVGFVLAGLIQHWIVTPIMMAVIVAALMLTKKIVAKKPVKIRYVSKNIRPDAIRE